MIKHLITGGCSFSAGGEYTGWTGALSSHMKTINPEVTCNHTGYLSQGKEMIQKKVMLALIEAFARGDKPEDILVVVMWSGTYRKAWYIDNHYIINEIISYLPKFVGGMSRQFLDMKDKVVGTPNYFSTALSDGFEYNPDGGWFFTVDGSECQIEFVQQHYLLDKELNGTGKVHTSLENIIMLQNFCDLHKVTMIQQFFMDSVYEDIENKKDHQIINYLYNQLNINNMIKIGMFEYLHKFLNSDKDPQILTHSERKKLSGDTDIFDKDGFHPGQVGYQMWVDNITVPFLKNKNII